MPYYLAIDAGGTKTHVLIANEQDEILADGRFGASNLSAVGLAVAQENFALAIEESIEQAQKKLGHKIEFHSAVVGLAGLDIKEEQKKVEELFAPVLLEHQCVNFQFVNDSWIALESGTSKADAMILIAGTGSNCLGRASDGRQAKAGGFDYLLSDEGSSYFVGQLALKYACKSYDGRGQKTLLEEMLVKHYQVANFAQLKLKIYQPALNKSQIAQLAQVVDLAYLQNDQVAKQIFDSALAELLLMLKTVINDLDLSQQNFDLVLIGGLLSQSYLKHQLVAKINQFYPKVNVIFPKQKPVYGALSLAKKMGYNTTNKN